LAGRILAYADERRRKNLTNEHFDMANLSLR
jgi:hypothetical protein